MSERDYKNKKLLYHVTALENLASIIEFGLLSRVDAEAKGLLKSDVADNDIIRKRRELGILNSVPFHFFEPFTDCIFKRYRGTTFVTVAITRSFAEANDMEQSLEFPALFSF